MQQHHRGRGVQYHLGFHHANDLCSGFITVTDSHYLHVALESRILSGYFLGCPMTDAIYKALKAMYQFVDLNRLEELLHKDNRTIDETDAFIQEMVKITQENDSLVYKENLIIIDPDILHDYPPTTPLTVVLPSDCADCKAVFAKYIPHDVMPLLLQRAKVILDLAMPGPERLAGII